MANALAQKLKELEKDETANKIKEDFLKKQEDAKQTNALVKSTMGDLASKLADPNSGLCKQLSDFYERRLPPGARKSSWTVEHFVTALDNEKFVQQLESAKELPMPDTSSFSQKLKDSFNMDNFKKTMKGLFQSAMHALAITMSVMALVEGGKQLHGFEIAQISISLAAEGLSLVGMGVRKLMTWGIARVKGWTRTISFFFNISTEGMKSLGRR